jgi:hypothetical protein
MSSVGPGAIGVPAAQQAALRNGDRAGQRGPVVGGDHLGERGGHGLCRLVGRSQHDDAGVAPRWIGADVAQSRSKVINRASGAGCGGHDGGSDAPLRFSATTVSTSWPAPTSTWLADREMLSSNLTLTRVGSAATSSSRDSNAPYRRKTAKELRVLRRPDDAGQRSGAYRHHV